MARLSSTMVTAIPFLRLRGGTHPLAAGPGNPGLLHRTGRSDRHAGRCHKNLGPGRRIVSKTTRAGVSRFGGQAGTQATDPTPTPPQNRAGRAGSTTHILPADYLQALAEPVPAPQARRSSRSEPAPRLPGFTTGSSRIPSNLARRTRPVWQYQAVPALSALLPALPGVSRIGLRSAPARLLRQPGEEVSHLPRFPAPHGAPAPRGAPGSSRRTS